MKNNYTLENPRGEDKPEVVSDSVAPNTDIKKLGFFGSFKKIIKSMKEFYRFMKEDAGKLPVAFIVIIIDSVAGIITPYLIALAVDDYISTGDIIGLRNIVFILAGIYIVTVFTGYLQGILMGIISQKTLFRLREALFIKLQELPIAFFNQNKAGDLMSRLNNDADKLNQFLGEWVSRFVGIMSIVLGIAVFAFFINIKLACAMLGMVIILIILTKGLSGWVNKRSKASLGALGSLNAALQENITNFRVVVAFNKREYFKSHLNQVNTDNRDATIKSDIATRIFEPMYEFAGAISLILVIVYGIYLISIGQTTVGVLIAFISYTQKFYDPLRTLAVIFGSLQSSLAAWTRITEIFNMKDNLNTIDTSAHDSDSKGKVEAASNLRLELRDISFSYIENQYVLENVSLQFEPGKTYALVGPTGGGKSTLVSIMSRLYDPDTGTVFLDGMDIRTYTKDERAKRVSVILQEPILFSGTVADNIRYGNSELSLLGNTADITDEALEANLKAQGFEEVIKRFENGLSTKIEQSAGGGLSLGQKQLISFMRAILRKPEILILDEATANIDTVTEAILEKALKALPSDTTKVIIAHRLNTIREADQIMFVNGHHVTLAGGLDEAIHLIENAKRKS